MTETANPQPDRIPIGQSVAYVVRGMPEVADEYTAERTIAPTEITLSYRSAPDSQLGRVSAYVKGWWMEGGARVPMDKPVGRWFYNGPDGWPDWLAEEARLHDPDAAVPSAPADRAAILREAADFLRDAHFRDGLSVQEIGTALRHMADEAQQPETQAPFIHVDDDGDKLHISALMASTYDGEAPVVSVAAEHHAGDDHAVVYVRPERVDEVITALRSARQAAETLPAAVSQPDEERTP